MKRRKKDKESGCEWYRSERNIIGYNGIYYLASWTDCGLVEDEGGRTTEGRRLSSPLPLSCTVHEDLIQTPPASQTHASTEKFYAPTRLVTDAMLSALFPHNNGTTFKQLAFICTLLTVKLEVNPYPDGKLLHTLETDMGHFGGMYCLERCNEYVGYGITAQKDV